MGLLDDAIREHLELKRLRGADPGEVAREQREALDPVPRDEPAASDHDPGAVGDVAHDARNETAQVDVPPAEANRPGAPQSASDVESPDDSRETAELDMRTLLHEDQETRDADNAAGGQAAPVSVQGDAGESGDEDSLEWEVPGDSAKRLAAHHGQGEHAGVDEGPAGTDREWDAATDQAEGGMQQARDPRPEPPEQERLRFDRSLGDSQLDK
jgi:hypothetical protein